MLLRRGTAGSRRHSGEFVAFLDADDEWLPEKLARQIEFMEGLGSSFSYTDSYIDRYGRRRMRYSALARPHSGEILAPLIDDWLDQAFITINTVIASANTAGRGRRVGKTGSRSPRTRTTACG